jgi:hypothetical protein
MNARNRKYHNIGHIYELCEAAEPIEVIAIAFHDLVYLNIDKRIHPLLKDCLSSYNVKDNSMLVLSSAGTIQSSLVSEIFGFKAGQEITFKNGLNEFLSGVCAATLLYDKLTMDQLITVLTCIEATIPFRSSEHTSEMAKRLKKKDINTNKIDRIMRHAVRVANFDVKQFASDNPINFINGTWDLNLEGHPILKNSLYSVQAYRKIIYGVLGFIRTLDKTCVFKKFSNEPSDEDFKELCQKVTKNIEVLEEYLLLKFTTASLLTAVAFETGGDAPLALFIGDLPSTITNHQSAIEGYLDYRVPVITKSKSKSVLDLLKKGRTNLTNFDFRHSPLSCYIYERISEEHLSSIYRNLISYYNKELDHITFIKLFPNLISKEILKAIAKVTTTRGKDILRLASILD